MDTRSIHLTKVLRLPLVRNGVKPGDNVLIVADTLTDPLIWEGLAASAFELGAEPTVTIMTPREYDHAEPPGPVTEAMNHADWIVLVPRKYWLGHSRACVEAQRTGHALICMEQTTVEMLSDHAGADYDLVQAIGDKIAPIMNAGKRIRVTSDAGTDLEASIEGRLSIPIAARAFHQGPTFCCAFPDGEVAICPVEGTAEGTAVFDVIMHMLGPLRSPVSLTFTKGRLVDIGGGADAGRLRETIETYGDENTPNLAEIAIGTNPFAQVVGIIRSDKKRLGFVHMALGSNTDMGGTVSSRVHLDMVMSGASLWVDDTQIIDKGRVLVMP